LDKELLSFSGAQCGKIGTSFQAFQTQVNPCNQPRGSCLEGQIKDYAGKPEYALNPDLEYLFGYGLIERAVRSQ
jgi:hypothetical protein